MQNLTIFACYCIVFFTSELVSFGNYAVLIQKHNKNTW